MRFQCNAYLFHFINCSLKEKTSFENTKREIVFTLLNLSDSNVQSEAVASERDYSAARILKQCRIEETK